ncbi:MAG: transporter [Spirochaetia bacterium]|nr:transporter [Spirochaetia bacterium]
MWVGLIVSVLLGAFGQILMKEGMKAAGPVPLQSGPVILFQYFVGAVFSIQLIGAALCYGISFVLWLGVLSVADLSLARPIMSVGYVLTLAYGFYAGESITPGRIIGTVLVVIGIAFIARSAVDHG